MERESRSKERSKERPLAWWPHLRWASLPSDLCQSCIIIRQSMTNDSKISDPIEAFEHGSTVSNKKPTEILVKEPENLYYHKKKILTSVTYSHGFQDFASSKI